nr:hypothetical protein GCM10025730_31390 [Promicromonospora thailandica]
MNAVRSGPPGASSRAGPGPARRVSGRSAAPVVPTGSSATETETTPGSRGGGVPPLPTVPVLTAVVTIRPPATVAVRATGSRKAVRTTSTTRAPTLPSQAPNPAPAVATPVPAATAVPVRVATAPSRSSGATARSIQ